MLSTQMNSVLKQALTTFTSKQETLFQNIDILKNLLSKITAQDVNLHSQFMTNDLWQRPNKAPVTYVDIYEDFHITIGIFVLKPNMKLPLHNHPQMHGLIKVLAGKLKITSYSLNTEKTGPKSPGFSRIITAERHDETIIDATSGCCLLEPEARNLHEIESIDGPAAFIDVLSPPYDSETDGDDARKCSYYQILKEIAPSVFRLQEVTSPSWYWTDAFPYTGPPLL